MSQLTINKDKAAALAERIINAGDLALLTDAERLQYYFAMCDRCGLNPLSRPFDYIETIEKGRDGKPDKKKLSLYPNQIAAAQLRKLHKVSIEITDRSSVDGLAIVTARAKTPDGRTDEAQGVVPLIDSYNKPLSPTGRANAWKKAEGQARRRVTIAICGLDFEGNEYDEDETKKSEYFDPPVDVIDLDAEIQAPRQIEPVGDIGFDREAAYQKIAQEMERLRWTADDARSKAVDLFQKESRQDMTNAELSKFIEVLGEQKPKAKTAEIPSLG